MPAVSGIIDDMDIARFPHTLILPIDPGHWAPPARVAQVDGIDFAPKTELHVTLIGSRLGHELHSVLEPRYLRQQLDRAYAAQHWQYTRSGRLLLLALRVHGADTAAADAPPRRSIIELIDLPAMQPFHQALGRLLGRQLPVPPPHVTLYTAGDPRGIGLPDPARLRALGHALHLPI